MDTITKVDNATYTGTTQVTTTYAVAEDSEQLETLQNQLDTLDDHYATTRATILSGISSITARLTAASNEGVSDATLVVHDQNNVQG